MTDLKQDKTIKWIVISDNGQIWSTGYTKRNAVFTYDFIVGKGAFEEHSKKRQVYIRKANVFYQLIR